MATAPPDAMQMPQQGASPFADPNAMAVYDQLRQTTSPKAFGDEMLAGAAQADPQAVAKFLQKLQSLNVPPEVLDALNNVVDEILANPERYDELRAKYIAQGLPEKILPAQFDPQFFVALNMAIDQMIAEPAGVQSFAQGGIAELKPIAKAIASYGRNGDTMLAHITPAEARMLRRRGGSGTTNPDTGLPEFFLDEIGDALGDVFGGIGDAIGDAIGGIGDAVQDFVESDVGRIVTTVALGYFLGPTVAAQFGVTSAVGVAAISGFVGGAGGTLLGGGSFEDALKAGAMGGLTAGAGAGVFGGSEAFAARPSITPGQAFQGQVDSFTKMVSPTPGGTDAIGAPNLAPVPTPADPLGDFIQQNDAARAAASTPARITAEVLPTSGSPPPYKTPTIGESFSKIGEGLGFGDKPASFDTFKQGAGDLFAPAGPSAEQINARAAELVNKTPTLPFKTAVEQATSELSPGMLRTYGPAAVAGLGALSAFGGFEAKPVQSGPITKQLMKPVTQRIAEKGTQRQMYSQGLPGVVYDQYGAPVSGQSVRLPTYDAPDYNSGGYGMPQGQQAMNMPAVYISPPGTIGSRRVEQPYNNSDMYPNLVPRQYAADGGLIQKFAFGGDAVGDSLKEVLKSVSPYSAEEQAAQKAARDAVAQQKALRKSQGSGQMYSNINAGLAALAPETNPMYAGPVGDLYRNMLSREPDAGGYEFWKSKFGDTVDAQERALFQASAASEIADRKNSVEGLYYDILRREPDAGGLEFWKSKFGDTVDEKERAAFQGAAAPEIAIRNNFVGEPAYQTFGGRNRTAGLAGLQTAYGPMLSNQRDAMNQQAAILSGQNIMPFNEQPFPMPRYTNAGRSALMNMGGIATLGGGGYPQRTGQISGPGTEKSDSIPAMLSDGEFVMTAKAVRGAGKGSRRAGAKKMYALMHRLEKNSERG